MTEIPEEYKQTIEAIESYISLLKIKKKRIKEILKTKNERGIKETLEEIEKELKNYRYLRRRAKCRIYNFKYNHSKHGRKSMNKKTYGQRMKLNIQLSKI